MALAEAGGEKSKSQVPLAVPRNHAIEGATSSRSAKASAFPEPVARCVRGSAIEAGPEGGVDRRLIPADPLSAGIGHEGEDELLAGRVELARRGECLEREPLRGAVDPAA